MSRFVAIYGFPPGFTLDYATFVGMMMNSNVSMYRDAMASYHGRAWVSSGVGIDGFRAMCLSEEEARRMHLDHMVAVDDAKVIAKVSAGKIFG